MNQPEKIILNTGFDRNSTIGVVLARLFKQGIPIGTVAVQFITSLHIPSVKMIIITKGELRRKCYLYVKLILAVPRLNYSIINLNSIINRNTFKRYGNTEIHFGDMQEQRSDLKKRMNALMYSVCSIPESGYLTNVDSFSSPLFNDQLIQREKMLNVIQHNRWFAKNNDISNKLLISNGFLKSTRIVEYLRLSNNADSNVNVNIMKSIDRESDQKIGLQKSKQNDNVDFLKSISKNTNNIITDDRWDTILGKAVLILNKNNLSDETIGKNNNYEPKDYFRIFQGRDKLTYTANVTIRSNSAYMISNGQHRDTLSLMQNRSSQNKQVSLQTTNSYGQLNSYESFVNKSKINRMAIDLSQQISITLRHIESIKKQAGLPLSLKNRTLITPFTVADKFTFRAIDRNGSHINDGQYLLNRHQKIMQKNETIHLIFENRETAKLLYTNKNNEMIVNNTTENVLLTKQNDLLHVKLVNNTLQRSIEEKRTFDDIENNKNVSASNKIVFQKPQGIADFPVAMMAGSHINELAEKVCCIIEGKIHTEAKRKGLL
jgi:hypothetical protein